MQQFNLAGPAHNPALKSQLEAQMGMLGALSVRTCDTMQRLSGLNMQLARELVEDTLDTCREILSCNDPMRMAATAMRRLQPPSERLGRYQHKLLGVIAEANANLPDPSRHVAAAASPEPSTQSARRRPMDSRKR